MENKWKSIIPFSRTSNVSKHSYWKVMDFCLEKLWSVLSWMEFIVVPNIVYFMFVHFTVYNKEHNPPRKSWAIALKITFSIWWGFENISESVVLVFRNLIALEKFWKNLGNILEVVCTSPVSSYQDRKTDYFHLHRQKDQWASHKRRRVLSCTFCVSYFTFGL